MDIRLIDPMSDKNAEDVNVVIEVPCGSNPVKYEFDKNLGAIAVDRILATPMYYPCNYGFIPNTLAGDGDPVDVLFVTRFPLVPGCVAKGRPIGVLIMEDEAGVDEKIIVCPSKKTDPFSTYEDIKDLPQALLNQIKHFFEHYKDLEKDKWVKIKSFGDGNLARGIIINAIKNYSK